MELMEGQVPSDGLVASGSSCCCPGSVPTQPLVSRKFGFYFTFNFLNFSSFPTLLPGAVSPSDQARQALLNAHGFIVPLSAQGLTLKHRSVITVCTAPSEHRQHMGTCSPAGSAAGPRAAALGKRQLGTMRISTVAHSLTSPRVWLALNKHPVNRIVKLTC